MFKMVDNKEVFNMDAPFIADSIVATIGGQTMEEMLENAWHYAATVGYFDSECMEYYNR